MTIPVFPTLPGLSWPVVRTPIWSTFKQDSWSGKSSPIAIWSYPRRRYTLTFDMLRLGNGFAEIQALEGFYNSVQGATGLFAYTDVDDQAVVGAPVAVGDGVTTNFQLTRPWGQSIEPVFAPRPGFAVTVGGQATAGFSIGANPGSLVFASAPANGAQIAWTGAYDWLCRFDDDSYDFSKFMAGLWSIGKIAFTTVKL